jgi:NTE family protein
LTDTRRTTIVFGGGNALAAYLAGAYESISAHGIEPDWVIGASAGAVTAAIIAGNPPERRMERLRQFWSETTTVAPTYAGHDKLRQYSNGWHAALSLLVGRPTIFRHRLPGFFAALPGTPNDIALYDHTPLRATLNRLVDFQRLNSGAMRMSVNCIDLEAGTEVVFDTTRTTITADHILASTAITPGFQPIEIDGRLLCDPGYVNNTPLSLAFDDLPEVPTLVIALELFMLPAKRPRSLDAILERTQDIVFASPTQRTIATLQKEFALRLQLFPEMPGIDLLHAIYQTPDHEVALKTLDFSAASIADRWSAGAADLARGLSILADTKASPGLTYRPIV